MDPLVEQLHTSAQPSGLKFRWWWLLVGFGVLVFVVLIIVSLAHGPAKAPTYPTGQIEVTTNSSQVAISLVWDGDPAKVSKVDVANGTGSLHSTVVAGPYTVTATLGNFSAQQIATVVAGKSIKVSLTPAELGSVEPVTDRPAISVVATSSELRYIDSSNGNLYTVDSSSNEHLIDSSHKFIQVQWANQNYGVGRNASGQIFAINGNSISPISTPVSLSSSNSSYMLAPNQNLYVSNGTKVFLSVSGGAFKQIYQSSSQVSLMTAGNVAVAASVGGEGDDDGHDQGNIVTITPSGQVSTRPGGAYGASWSVSGIYLAITTDEQTVVTNASLKVVNNIPVGNVNSPVWLDNTTMFYGVASNLWEFNISTGKASLLTTISSGDSISDIYPSLSADYVYLTMQNNSTGVTAGTFYLDRVGLEGQSTSSIAIALSGLLPEPIGNCTAGYINFTKATIEVRGPGAVSGSCTAATQAFLQPYSSVFDVSAVPYQYITD